jgi:hypothetical protein
MGTILHMQNIVWEKAAIAKFQHFFEEEMSQEAIQEMHNWYSKRLHECRRAGGQMTRYYINNIYWVLVLPHMPISALFAHM